MACVTLKRPLEFDNLYSPHSSHGSNCTPRPHKRRKLLPMSVSSQQLPLSSQINSLHKSKPLFHKHQEHAQQQESVSSQIDPDVDVSPSPFAEATPSLLKDDIAQYVREEIRRLKRRRLLQSSPDHKSMDDSVFSDDNRTPSPPTSFNLTYPLSTSGGSSPTKDEPLFSFRQVVNLCETVLKERDIEVGKEYAQELIVRKAEQYDSFVRFSEDQLQSSTSQDRPTYLS